MTSRYPGKEEDSKGRVGELGSFRVHEKFCELDNTFSNEGMFVEKRITHGKEDVGEIHGTQYGTAYPCPIQNITQTHQASRDDVVSKHLVVVLPSCF